MHPEYMERETRLISHNRERALRRQEVRALSFRFEVKRVDAMAQLESRRPQQQALPGWRADVGGILSSLGVTEPLQPESKEVRSLVALWACFIDRHAQALPKPTGLPDNVGDLHVTNVKETQPAGYAKADELLARIDRGEILDASHSSELVRPRLCSLPDCWVT